MERQVLSATLAQAHAFQRFVTARKIGGQERESEGDEKMDEIEAGEM